MTATLLAGKWRTVGLLALAELLAMSVWFSASAVVPQLTADWGLGGARQSWLTMSVQVGFVAGALLSAILNLVERRSRRCCILFCRQQEIGDGTCHGTDQ